MITNLEVEIRPSPNFRRCHEVVLHFTSDGVKYTAVDTFESEVNCRKSQQDVFNGLSFVITRMLKRHLKI